MILDQLSDKIPWLRVKSDLNIPNDLEVEGTELHFNEKNELINLGETLLVFVNMATNRPCLPSVEFLDKLKPFFK